MPVLKFCKEHCENRTGFALSCYILEACSILLRKCDNLMWFASFPQVEISLQMESHKEQYTWYQLSPRHLEHRVHIPTAITLHKLVPKPTTTMSQVQSVHTYKVMAVKALHFFVSVVYQLICVLYLWDVSKHVVKYYAGFCKSLIMI